MDNTSRKIDLALAETLIIQKETYSKDEYQKYKYELLQCIIGESISDKNFHYFTRSNSSRANIKEIGQDGLIIELIKNAIKFYSYVTLKTWCRLQTPVSLNINSDKFNVSNVVPFIVDEVRFGRIDELISGMKSNINLCEAAIASFVETRYERGLFNKDLDEIYLNDEESLKLINMVSDFKGTINQESNKRIA